EKIGASPVTITSGEHKDLASPFRQLSEEERRILQDAIDGICRQFVRDVAAGRRMDVDEVAALADGRFYTGEQALENKLIDRLGGYQEALEYAAKKAGLPSPPEIEHLQRTLPLFYFSSLSKALGLDILNRRDLNALTDHLLLSPYTTVK
ncbi:MAG: S49 family peptidase, partial [bacterium]